MALAKKTKLFMLIGLAVAILLAVVVAPFASSLPDGLEKVAEEKGLLERGKGPQSWRFSPLPDYMVPGLGAGPLATAAAGLIGTLVVFLTGWGLAHIIRMRAGSNEEPHSEAGGREESGLE